jgi:hypothetical protein
MAGLGPGERVRLRAIRTWRALIAVLDPAADGILGAETGRCEGSPS